MEAVAMTRYPGSMRQRGVTLMELMVVMVVVGILAAIAIPSYRQYVIRATRTDAKTELLGLASRLERCFTRTFNYTRMDDVPNACVTVPYTMTEGTYTITGNIAAATFTLTATPQAGQADDALCGAFTINQLGQQGITGTGTAVGCWGGRRQ
jgi:type IV pilus assembly protein PilE